MAKAGYIGIQVDATDNIPKKIKNIFFGVNGVAKKVKKAYIGIENVAKLWFSSGSSPSSATYIQRLLPDADHGNDSGVSVGKNSTYIMVAGGYEKGTTLKSTVTAFDSNMQEHAVGDLQDTIASSANATIGDYCIFCGGWNGYASLNGNSICEWVSAYNSSFTRKKTSVNSVGADGCGASNSKYAIFPMCQTPDHGAEPDLSPSSTSVYAFNSDIVLSTQPASLTKVNNEGSIEACAASHNNYALILGHTNGQSSHFVDCYDTSLTKTSYSIPSYGIGGTTKTHAILCANQETAYAYDNNKSRSSFLGDSSIYSSVSDANMSSLQDAIDGNAVFISSDNSSIIVYSDDLVKTTIPLSTYLSNTRKVGGLKFLGNRLFVVRSNAYQVYVYDLS